MGVNEANERAENAIRASKLRTLERAVAGITDAELWFTQATSARGQKSADCTRSLSHNDCNIEPMQQFKTPCTTEAISTHFDCAAMLASGIPPMPFEEWVAI